MIGLKQRTQILLVFTFLATLIFSASIPLMSVGNFQRETGNAVQQFDTNSIFNPDYTSISPVPPETQDSRTPLDAPFPLTNYTIVAVLNPPTNSVSGFTKIFYVNHAGVALNELVFHIYPNAFQPSGNLQISSIESGGSGLDYTVTGSDQTLLTVDLVGGSGPGQLAPGEIIEVDLHYDVYIPYRQDRFGWYHRESPYEFLAYNLGNWHPIIAVYDDRGWDTNPYSHMGESFYSDVANFTVHLTVPEDYIVAATGELQSITLGSGIRTWHYSTGPVRDFTWCASPQFQTASIMTSTVNVTSYYVTEHEAGGQRVLQVAEQCLDIFGSLFGAYAWPSLHIVETDFWAGGMEYPQLVMIGTGLYDSPDGISYLAVVTAHEIGHEWIPFTLGTDSYTEPWIDEGFASFTEYAWVEYVYGSTARADYRQSDLDRYWEFVEAVQDESINQSMAYWQTTDWYAYGRIAYAKAALVYDMLRHQLGNATFYQAWQDIYTQAIHTNLRARTLQQYFEASVGESLDWFFDQWVYGSGVVTLSLGPSSVTQINNQWLITFELHQSPPSPIRLRVPVTVSFGGLNEEFWVWVEAEDVTVHTIVVGTNPLALLLDPNQLLLCQYITNVVTLSSLPVLLIMIAIGVIVLTVVIVVIVIVIRHRQST